MKTVFALLLVTQATVAIADHAVKPHAGLPYADGVDGIYPNPKLTPGKVDQTVTQKMVCTPGYTAKSRDVDDATKKKILAEYGIRWDQRSCCEVDHFVPLELGGSNDMENLWPEPYAGAFGARKKDVVESSLHGRVCAGKLSLKQAQDSIRKDWLAEYSKCCKGQGN